MTKEEQDQRWVEHFRESLNQPEPKSTFVFDLRDFSPELQVKTDTMTDDEVEQAVKKLNRTRQQVKTRFPQNF